MSNEWKYSVDSTGEVSDAESTDRSGGNGDGEGYSPSLLPNFGGSLFGAFNFGVFAYVVGRYIFDHPYISPEQVFVCILTVVVYKILHTLLNTLYEYPDFPEGFKNWVYMRMVLFIIPTVVGVLVWYDHIVTVLGI